MLQLFVFEYIPYLVFGWCHFFNVQNNHDFLMLLENRPILLQSGCFKCTFNTKEWKFVACNVEYTCATSLRLCHVTDCRTFGSAVGNFSAHKNLSGSITKERVIVITTNTLKIHLSMYSIRKLPKILPTKLHFIYMCMFQWIWKIQKQGRDENTKRLC